MSAPLTPPAVLEAVEALEARRRELVEAQAAHRRAQREIATARRRDTEAIAAALDAREKRPARQEESRALKAAESAALELEVAVQRVANAEARADAAIDAHGAAWQESVEAATLEADEEAAGAVAALREALSSRNARLAERQRVVQIRGGGTLRAQALARGPAEAGPGTISTFEAANGNPESAERVLAALEEHIQTTGVAQVAAAEHASREERRLAAERQAERDRQTIERERAEAAQSVNVGRVL